MDRIELTKDIVLRHRINKNELTKIEEVYVVWFCKTLQNWKALASTSCPDTKYYEITYNGDKNQIYLDEYEKNENVVIDL